MGRYAVGKLDWKRCDFKRRRNVERVTQEQTLAGRLFQMVRAAEYHSYLQCPGVMLGFTWGWRLGSVGGLCLQSRNKPWPHYRTWNMALSAAQNSAKPLIPQN